MKTVYLCLIISLPFAIKAQVGINTTSPEATLQIQADTSLPDTQPQGISFPNFTTAERENFIDVRYGTLIYNTDLKCIEMYSNTNTWKCIQFKQNTSL